MKRFSLFIIIALMTGAAGAEEQKLSLDSCISLALANNKEVANARTKQEVAKLNRKEAFTHYLPHVSGTAGYMRAGSEISLLSDEQKTKLSNVGTSVGTQLKPMLQGAALQNPGMASLYKEIGGLAQSMVPALNKVGEELVDAFRTDTRNVTAAALSLTQPLYMGGKIMAYNKITKYAEQIAKAQADQKVQELVVQVETAYWQIVALESKRELALSYKSLIDTLDNNVEKLIREGMASKADGLSVKVKKNEADVTLIQIDNGLSLSRMLLSQLCGLDVNTEIHPSDDILQAAVSENYSSDYVAEALGNRPELKTLDLLARVNTEKVKVVRSDYLPKLALTANYMWTNPSCFNSFEKKMKGMWTAGVMLQVPLIDWGEGYYKVKAAKLEANMTTNTLNEVREKVELQVTQCAQKVLEAAHREETAQRSMAQAEENLRFANLGMQEGVIPISDVLAAQTAWLSARSTIVTARIDRRLAEVNMKRALGR